MDNKYSVTEGESFNEEAPGILANDIGTSLTTVLVDDVQHGTLTLNADGSFTYEPEADFTGSDTFTYIANDGTLDSNIATVSINVNNQEAEAPIAVDDLYETELNSTLEISAEKGVLVNDSNLYGDELSAIFVDDVQHGTLTLNTDGSFTYESEADFTGLDTFTYMINNGTINSNIATVTITVTIQKVTLGTPVYVTPKQAQLPKDGTFDKGKAKIYGILGGKNLNLKKDKYSTPELIKGFWAKKCALYDKKAVKNGYATVINGKPQAKEVPLTVKGKTGGIKFEKQAQSVTLVPPEITSVTVSGNTINITGKFFGNKVPKVALEPATGGKLAKCKVDKKSYSNPEGRSDATVKAIYDTKKVTNGIYHLILDNKIGIGVVIDEEGNEVLPTVIIGPTPLNKEAHN